MAFSGFLRFGFPGVMKYRTQCALHVSLRIAHLELWNEGKGRWEGEGWATRVLAALYAAFLRCPAACAPPQQNMALGWADDDRGWYDLKGTGCCNDYCRWLGSCGPRGSCSWWSCALAGTRATNTEAGVVPFLGGRKCAQQGSLYAPSPSPSASPPSPDPTPSPSSSPSPSPSAASPSQSPSPSPSLASASPSPSPDSSPSPNPSPSPSPSPISMCVWCCSGVVQ